MKNCVDTVIIASPTSTHYELINFFIREVKNILSDTKTIAMIGLSADENRPSNFAAKYLQTKATKLFLLTQLQKKNLFLEKKFILVYLI